jgi:hypothetical protein
MGRTYTKKSSEKHFHTKIADRNYQIADRKLSLVHSGKNAKIVDRNFGIMGRKCWAGNAKLQF